MHGLKTRLRDWAVRHAASPRAGRWLAILSFAEASFFPIPPDVLLLSILSARQSHRWRYYALIATVWSVAGGVAGYVIGKFLYDSIGVFLVETYNLGDTLGAIRIVFSDNAFLAVFLGGFTPIPYKAFTLSAGFFNINFFVFMAASVLSRAMRFFAVGYIMKIFGKEIGAFVFRYFNILTILFGVVLVLFALLFSVR